MLGVSAQSIHTDLILGSDEPESTHWATMHKWCFWSLLADQRHQQAQTVCWPNSDTIRHVLPGPPTALSKLWPASGFEKARPPLTLLSKKRPNNSCRKRMTPAAARCARPSMCDYQGATRGSHGNTPRKRRPPNRKPFEAKTRAEGPNKHSQYQKLADSFLPFFPSRSTNPHASTA